MVVRLRGALTRDDLDMASQSALAPVASPLLPEPWRGGCVVAEPASWEGGIWHPGLRSVTLSLVNAGPGRTVIWQAQVDGDWLAEPVLERPIELPGYCDPVPLTIPIRPGGLRTGRLRATLRLEGPGWRLPVPLRLTVPSGSHPWWDEPGLSLATHLRSQRLRLHACVSGAGAVGEVAFFGTAVAAPPPVPTGDGWDWELDLFAGPYNCTLKVDGKAVPLEVAAPHRWEWEHAGAGRLLVGGATAGALLRNVGDSPVEAYLESDAAWLEVEPTRLKIAAGESAAITVRDHLTALHAGQEVGHVRVLSLAGRAEWTSLPVHRSITAEMALPVLSASAVDVRVIGSRGTENVLTVHNVGTSPLTFSVAAPAGVRLPGGAGPFEIAAGGWKHLSIAALVSEDVAETLRSDTLLIRTNSAYPVLQEIRLPVTIYRLRITAEPGALDFGSVKFNGAESRRISFSRSDRAHGLWQVAIPTGAQSWLAYKNERFTVRNWARSGGPVATTVVVRDGFSGAELEMPVQAELQMPTIRVAHHLSLGSVRPGHQISKFIPVADAGHGLLLHEVKSMQRLWLRAVLTPQGVEATVVRPGPIRQTLRGELQLSSNDPARPVVRIAVEAEVVPTIWDTVSYWLEKRRLRWLVPALAGLVLLLLILLGGYLGVILWRHTGTQTPGVPPANAGQRGEAR